MNDVQTTIEAVAGFRVAGVHCGLKKDGALDFALIASDHPCTAAGVFTTNLVKAAPVLVDVEHLHQSSNHIRAVVINAGCANACTGQQGIENAESTSELVAQVLGCDAQQVLVMSTGVIGTHLQMDKIQRGVNTACQQLGGDWHLAARAIMTTDTRPKMTSVKVTTEDGSYTIAGIAKGAGMIAPNMATMLSVVVTDAKLTVKQAQGHLRQAARMSFNRIVVDGDMSTNDTLLLLANGVSNVVLESQADESQFYTALEAVCRQLAQGIVRDGEGVTKFITLNVLGALDDGVAHAIANTIATSALVKTAFYGGDANWGRIIAAAGRAAQPFDPHSAQLWIAAGEQDALTPDALLLFEAGEPTDYNESEAQSIMSAPSITVTLNCGDGEGWATVWTCDFSHDYVSINGHYRT